MNKLEKALRTQDKSTQKKKTELSGTLGVILNGVQTISVPNRAGFVYVLLNTKEQELIQAFNDKVSTSFGLAVIVIWNVNRYEVLRKDDLRYGTWNSNYLPKHGNQHSFNPDGGGGGDVTYIYGKQFVPLSLTPSGTFGAPVAIIAPYARQESGWHYVPDTPTPNIVNHRPTNNQAKMVLVCLDWQTGNSQIIIGTGTFNASLTGSADVIPYLPATTGVYQIPIAGVRLVSGTTAITWQNIYDVRQYFHPTFTGTGAGGSTGSTPLPYNLNNYLPDVPPASAGLYDDEFDDDVINTGTWVLPSYDANFSMTQTTGTIHLSESIYHGYLMMQGNFASDGAYNFYKTFNPLVSANWTVVAKFSLGYNAVTNDIYCGLGVRGNADNVYYELRVGRNTVDKGYRTVYANGGGAAEGVVSCTDYPLVCYLMITHDGSKNFSSFVSGDGLGWTCLELNRNLSNLSSFTRLSIFSKSGVVTANGIVACDFIRFFPLVTGQYKIGKDV